MKKIRNTIVLLIPLLFFACVSSGDLPEDYGLPNEFDEMKITQQPCAYYEKGVATLNDGKTKEAEEYFLKSIYKTFQMLRNVYEIENYTQTFQDNSLETLRYDITQAKNSPEGDWKAYYYKAVLDSQVIFDFNYYGSASSVGGYAFLGFELDKNNRRVEVSRIAPLYHDDVVESFPSREIPQKPYILLNGYGQHYSDRYEESISMPSNHKGNKNLQVDFESVIALFNKSISIKDNYQSHLYLAALMSDEKAKQRELDAGIRLAASSGNRIVASKIEYLLGCKKWLSGNFSNEVQLEALAHFKKSIGYLWNENAENDFSNVSYQFARMKKAGFDSYEEFYEYERKESQERENQRRQSWSNLYAYLTLEGVKEYRPFYNSGHTRFEKGDIIDVPAGSLKLFDVSLSGNTYTYLFSTKDFSEYSKCGYIKSPRQLQTYGQDIVYQNVRLQYVGTSSYRSGVSVKTCYVFNLID